MKILFILEYYRPHLGGTETVFENMIKLLKKDGHEIIVLTSRFDEKLEKEEIIDGVRIFRAGTNRTNFIWSGFCVGMKILKNNPDIQLIHTSTFSASLPASLLSFLFKKRSVITVHEVFGKLRYKYKGRKGRFFLMFEKLIMSLRFDVWHAVSIYTANCLRTIYGIPDGKIKMIYNGVDYNLRNSNFLDNSKLENMKKNYGLEGKFVGVYYGHSGASKGIDFLVDALPGIVAKIPNFVLIINLIPAKRHLYITKKLKDLSLDKHILMFTGMIEKELVYKVALGDVVIAPSLSEGFGCVVSEASALGKTIITTNVSSIPEVVSGKVRFISPSSSEEIVQAVVDVYNNENIQYIPEKKFERKTVVVEQ